MNKEQVIQMMEAYVKWIEMAEAQLKSLAVSIDIATNNIRACIEKLKTLP